MLISRRAEIQGRWKENPPRQVRRDGVGGGGGAELCDKAHGSSWASPSCSFYTRQTHKQVSKSKPRSPQISHTQDNTQPQLHTLLGAQAMASTPPQRRAGLAGRSWGTDCDGVGVQSIPRAQDSPRNLQTLPLTPFHSSAIKGNSGTLSIF